MPFLTCPHCQAQLKSSPQHAGKRVRCPKCKQIIPPVDDLEVVEDPTEEPTSSEPDQEETPAALRGPPETLMEDWRPRKLCNHGGKRVPKDADFFAPPPPEIGRILSATTSLRKGEQPTATWVVLTATLGGGFLGFCLCLGLNFTADWGLIWEVIFPPTGLILGLTIGLLLFAFAHELSYVGEKGFAQFYCVWNRNAVLRSRVLCFRDVSELRTYYIKHYVNGRYTGTDYFYNWENDQGRIQFSYWGTHRSEDNRPPADDVYHFHKSAELAWTHYLLEEAEQKLERSGWVKFNLRGDRWVRLGKEGIHLKLRREVVKLPAATIDSIHIEEGELVITPQGSAAMIMDAQSEYKIKLEDLANSQLFLVLLERLHGLKCT